VARLGLLVRPEHLALVRTSDRRCHRGQSSVAYLTAQVTPDAGRIQAGHDGVAPGISRVGRRPTRTYQLAAGRRGAGKGDFDGRRRRRKPARARELGFEDVVDLSAKASPRAFAG